MKQYIDKNVLKSKIERRIDSCSSSKDIFPYDMGREDSYWTVLDIIDGCEVKEVDDDKLSNVKEVDLEKELIEWHKNHFKKDGTFIGMSGFYLTNNSQLDIAKYFFELGSKSKN